MNLFDYFFRRPARIARFEETQRSQNRQRQKIGSLRHRIQQLEENQGAIALVLGSLLEKLDDTGVLARGDIEAKMQELDEYDGIRDGRLNIVALQELVSNADSFVAADLGLSVVDESVHEEIASMRQQFAELQARFE